MLLESHRHNPDDLREWSRLERFDTIFARSPDIARREKRAGRVLREFAAAPCYVGVSWGKDSVVVAHLAYRLGKEQGLWPPLVWVRVEPIANPDCAEVRDAFFGLCPEARDHYHEIEIWCERGEHDWHATGTLEAGFAQAVELTGASKHVSGVRGEEAGYRMGRMERWGESSPNTCAPIGWWKAQHVFAYLHKHNLPVHPAYAMSLGGTLDRGRIRVSSLFGERGTGFGRREWEHHYYGDVERRLERLKETPCRRVP